MPRKKKPKYPDSSWGREAREEDISTHVESELLHRRDREERLAFDDASKRLQEGELVDSIIGSVPEPAIWGPSDFPDSFGREVHNRVEREIQQARLRGVRSAIKALEKMD